MYILILLLIVVVIFKFLFSNFGNLNERDINERDKILDQLSRIMNNGGQNEIIIKDVNPNDNVNDGREIDINNELINTAKKVIETVNLALSDNDEKVLSELLTKDLFVIFKKNIDENMINNRVFKTIVVSFEDVVISGINMNSMNVKVVMNQINYIQDNNGNFLSGDKSKIVKVIENWEFVKNTDKTGLVPWLINNISECNA